MEHNPYKAPDATVDDRPGPVPPRPKEITRACQIFWVVIVVSLLALHPSISGEWWGIPDVEEFRGIGMIGVIAISAVSTAIFVVLVWLVGRRHNWARWALLTYLLFGWFVLVTDLLRSMSETPLAALINVLMVLGEIWAFYLLFFGPGAQWFRRTYAP